MVSFRFSSFLLTTFSLLSLAAAFSVPLNAVAGDVIPDSYIVVMRSDAEPEVVANHETWVTNSTVVTRRLMKRGRRRALAGLRKKYHLKGLTGYTGEFDAETVKEIKARPEVAFVEKDTVITIQGLVRNPMPILTKLHY